MSDSNNSFFDNVSTKITKSATDQKDKISNSVTKAENISNNSNLSASTKIVAGAFAAKEVYDSITKAIPNIVDAAIEAPILGIIGSLGLKGMACLPIAKQLDPVLGIDIHMVTIPPSPAPVPMPHPFIGILLNPRDFISIAAAVVVSEFKDPIVPVDSENPTEKEQHDMNIEAIKDITYSIIKSKYGLNATVFIDGKFPRAVAGTPTKNIPHFPMGTGFHPGYSRMVKKDNGHSLLGSLVALADGAPISGGQAHLFNCCWDIGIFSPHSKSKRRKIGVELYLPTGIIIPFPMSKTILTNPIPAPFNPITKLQNFVKSSFGRFFKKKLTSKGKKKENNPNETLPPGTKRNAAGRLIDSKTGKFVKDPNKKNRGSANSNKKNRKAQQLKKNNTNGKKRESEVKNELLAEGHEVIGSQVSVKTDHTRRVVDHLIIDKDTKELVAVEVKSGNATRNATQILKDDSMASKGGKIIGKNAPEKLLNKTKTIKTIIRN